jgi:hypothetical protein
MVKPISSKTKINIARKWMRDDVAVRHEIETTIIKKLSKQQRAVIVLEVLEAQDASRRKAMGTYSRDVEWIAARLTNISGPAQRAK